MRVAYKGCGLEVNWLYFRRVWFLCGKLAVGISLLPYYGFLTIMWNDCLVFSFHRVSGLLWVLHIKGRVFTT